MAKGELWFRNKYGGLFKVTSQSAKANRANKKEKKIQKLNKELAKMEKEASNIATGAKSQRTINSLFKVDEEIRDFKSDIKAVKNRKRSFNKPKVEKQPSMLDRLAKNYNLYNAKQSAVYNGASIEVAHSYNKQMGQTIKPKAKHKYVGGK